MRFHVFAILLLSNLTVHAADPKPNELTAKEFAAGWVSLFDGETTFGWTVNGKAEIKDGKLVLGRENATVMVPTGFFGRDFEVDLIVSGGRFTVANKCYLFAKDAGGGRFQYARSLGTTKVRIPHIDFETRDIVALQNDLSSASFILEADPGNVMTIHSLKIRLSNSKELFNGKDLTGWKRFTGDPKRELSKFEVTKAGELHLTNGSGDLQSEKSFKDFCLQLECKTNGDKLNSGIFFRCLPGQYQQGYEAQIHNGFKDNDRTKPTDFGTGAIYRRIPARKVVPNDKEWFTMTVLAVGPRLRTWVNGYPTVDWVDERPVNANARSGRKLDAGPISIQGHDPTTDLLFRNIRIVEIETDPKK